VLPDDVLLARDSFSFWEPLDAYFDQTMVKLANYTKMSFMVPWETPFFSAYLTYNSSYNTMPPAQIISQENQQAQQNMMAGLFTSTALSYYHSIVSDPDHTAPSTPSNLKGVSGNPTQVYLTWTASTDNVGVAGYYVYRNGVQVASTAPNSYMDTGLSDGTTYSYYVEAYDLAGNISAPSLEINVTTFNTIPPTAPTNVKATVVSSKQIQLTWTASTDKVGICCYYIFRGSSPQNLVQVGEQNSTPTSYGFYPLEPGTTYYFGIEAVDKDGNVSSMSQIVSATTPQ
jgi:chitodextrinase